MFPASTHKGQAVTAFPDVCKTPTPVASPTPIPYPNIGTTSRLGATKTTYATKPSYATKTTATKTSGDEAAALRGVLSTLHQKLMMMGGGDTTAWHAAVDNYVMTSAALYKTLSSR